MKWILKRLAEPSTAAGISALAQAVYGAVYAGLPLTVAVPAALAGMFAVVKGESGSTATPSAK